jgi:N-acyl-D-amino-acid deacylase
VFKTQSFRNSHLSIFFVSFLFTFISNELKAQTNTTILFKNFILIDGSGNKSEIKDVRIKNDKIILIGSLLPQPGETIIDGRNKLILAPGFIDTHSHHSRNLDDSTQFSSFLCQGITTLIVGQDGSSYLPLRSYYQDLKKAGVPVNIASYSGHNTIRYEVLGNENFNRLATSGEIKKMKKILRTEMKAGALGLSTGLEYDPGIFSSKEEVMQLALVAARRDGRYISHIRSEDINLEGAIDEIIQIGRRTRMPVQISHIKIAMKKKWGMANDIIATLNKARKEGINITADIYPYDYWLSNLEVQFPKRDFDNKASAEFALSELAPPEGMILSKYDARPEWVGKSIADISRERKEDPADTYMYLIKLAHDMKADESVMGRSMTESDIIALMQWPYTNICSDGFGGGRHPRGVGSFPRVLHHYVKEMHAMTVEEAIRKMTSLSAEHMGIEHRGKISHEYQADLIIIDPDKVTDKSTLQDPYALSEGIDGVWVNGVRVWKENKYLGVRPGEIIKNTRYK